MFFYIKGIGKGADNEVRDFLLYVKDTIDTFANASNSLLVHETYKVVKAVKQNKENGGGVSKTIVSGTSCIIELILNLLFPFLFLSVTIEFYACKMHDALNLEG